MSLAAGEVIAPDENLPGCISGLQLLPIKVLHRHDGYISFAVRGEDDLRPVVSIRANALDEWFPEFTDRLLRDSMVSINASYCLARRRTDLPYGSPAHRKDTLRYLCACYADLDYYKLGLEVHQVIGEIARMCLFDEIPQPSLTIDSGHGMWLMWMLDDPKDTTRAHCGSFDDNPNDHLQLYAKINRELAKRLMHLGADSCPSAAAYVRAPGSFRNDTERYVKWAIYGNADRPYSYILKELARTLCVLQPMRPVKERQAISSVRQVRGNRSRGWKRSNENRLTAIVTIKDLRGGGFAKGVRNGGAYFYALALRWNGESKEDATAAVFALGRDCRPPLTETECRGAVKQAFKGGRTPSKVRYQTLADQLDVSPQEAEFVSQTLGKPFPAASRFGELIPCDAPTSKNHFRFERCPVTATFLATTHVHKDSLRVRKKSLKNLRMFRLGFGPKISRPKIGRIMLKNCGTTTEDEGGDTGGIRALPAFSGWALRVWPQGRRSRSESSITGPEC